MSDALSGEVEHSSDFFGGHFVSSDSEEHFEHLTFTFGECAERCIQIRGERLFLHLVVRSRSVVVRHDVNEAVGVVVLERCIDAHLLSVGAQCFLHFGDVRVQNLSEFSDGGSAFILLLKVDDGFGQLALESDLVERHAHDAALFGDCLQDALAYPPNGVGDEFEAACFVKFLCGFDEAEVAFVNEVVEGKSLVLILLGNADDKAEVGAGEAVEGFLVAFVNALSEFHFLIGGDEFLPADFHEIFIKGGTGAVCDAFVYLELSHSLT